MSMNLTVYVGPYLIVPKSSVFDWMLWDSVVSDGRGEAGVGEPYLILIPNQKLEGVTRCLTVDRHGEQQMAQISPAAIVRESDAFALLASEVIQWCDSHGVEVHEAWGVVPRWS